MEPIKPTTCALPPAGSGVHWIGTLRHRRCSAGHLCERDFNFGNNSGSGVLVVTGTVSFTGNSSFNGLILVIGQGSLRQRRGHAIHGSIFLRKTNSSVSTTNATYRPTAALGSPTLRGTAAHEWYPVLVAGPTWIPALFVVRSREKY